MSDIIQVTITIDDKKVTIEGPRDFVEAEVQRLTSLVVGTHKPQAEATGGVDLPVPSTERTFIASKKPKGHPQIVAVLAYFLAKGGREEFTPDDMRRAYARAGVRPPKVIAQALRDAKNVHDYLEQGSTRGAFRLTAHGERTVEFDLPAANAD